MLDAVEQFSEDLINGIGKKKSEIVKEKMSKKKEEDKELELEFQKALVEDAMEEISASVNKLDTEWFPALVGGHYRIVNKKQPLRQMSDRDAADTFISDFVTIHDFKTNRDIKLSAYQKWKEQAEVYIGGLYFDPNQQGGKISDKYGHSTWNMWSGWDITADESKDCSLYLKHIEDNICQGNIDAYNWLLDWMAHIIQKPGTHLDKVPAIRGIQGCGKTAFVETFQSILNGWSSTIGSADIDANFNSILMNKLLVAADEAVWSGNNSTLNKLKQVTGNSRISIELKGKDKFELNNFMRLIITTNNDWCAPTEKGNRRYVILTCGSAQAQNRKYFQAIEEQMNSGGREKLMWILSTRDISLRDWSDTPIFDKEANEENLMATMSSHDPVGKWLKQCVDRETDPLDNIFIHNGKQIKSKVAYEQYKHWSEDSGEFRVISADKFSKDLKKYSVRSRITSGPDKGGWGYDIDEHVVTANINSLFI